jgi:hypothetical protein
MQTKYVDEVQYTEWHFQSARNSYHTGSDWFIPVSSVQSVEVEGCPSPPLCSLVLYPHTARGWVM